MLLFWAQGYEGTSVRDLTAATGISSSSMYEVFGDKRALFLAALTRYCRLEQGRITQMAQDAPTPQAFIEALFASVDELSHTASPAQGSLAFNTLVEFSTRDPDITALLLDHYFRIAEIIAAVLGEAQAAGVIHSSAAPLPLAYTFLSALHGIATLKGVKPDFAHHNHVLQTLLRLLDT